MQQDLRDRLFGYLRPACSLFAFSACVLDTSPFDEYRVALPDAGAVTESDAGVARTLQRARPASRSLPDRTTISEPTSKTDPQFSDESAFGAAMPSDPTKPPGRTDDEAPNADHDAGGVPVDPMVTTRPSAASVSLDIVIETAREAPTFKIYRPRNLESPETLPVVAWAGCVREEETLWTPAIERWASGGFVVLSLSQPTPNADNTSPPVSPSTEADHVGLIDAVFWLNERSDLVGKLDVQRIVVAGAGCAGSYALQVAAEDKRVAAAFVLSGSSGVARANADVMLNIDVPVGYVVGGEADIPAARNAVADFNVLTPDVPAAIISHANADHLQLVADRLLLLEIAEISLGWMDLAVNGNQFAYATLTSTQICARCTPGAWTLQHKHLDLLVR